jgi:hypothetical protein
MAGTTEKLIKLFAIEPESVTTWNDFRYVFEKFGFSEGRLVVKVPSPDWAKKVLSGCVSEFERIQIEEKLRRSAGSTFVDPPPMGSAYTGSWLQGAKNVHVRRALDGVVVRDEIPETQRFTKISTVAKCTDEFFGDAGQTVVPRDAKSLAAVATELLALSSRAVIVDQYFSSRPQFLRSLTEFLKLASENGCEYFEVLTKAGGDCDQRDLNFLAQNYDQIFRGCRHPISLVVKVLNPKVKAADFHHRLLLSDAGGIRYDAGMDAVDAEKENDVAVLNRSFHAKQVARYLGSLEEFQVRESVSIGWTTEDVARGKRAVTTSRR